MRTLDGCIEELKREDPNTSLTRHALRLMVLSGQVPSIKVGAGAGKYLINYDGLLSVLSGECAKPEILRGNIRRIG